MNELAKMMDQFVKQGVLTEEAVLVLTREFDEAVSDTASKIAAVEIEKETANLRSKLTEEAKSIASRDLSAKVEELANELVATRLQKEIPALKEVLTEEAREEIYAEFRTREITIVKEAENYINKTVEEQVSSVKTKLETETLEHKQILEEQVMSTITSYLKTEIVPNVDKIIVEEEISKTKKKLLEESLAKDEAISQLTSITNNLAKIIEENRKETSSAYLRKVERRKTIEEATRLQVLAEKNQMGRRAELAKDILEEDIEWNPVGSPELIMKKALAKKAEIDKINVSRARRDQDPLPYPAKVIELLSVNNDSEVSQVKADRATLTAISRVHDSLTKLMSKQDARVAAIDISAFKGVSLKFHKMIDSVWSELKDTGYIDNLPGFTIAELSRGPIIDVILKSPLATKLVSEFETLKATYGEDTLDAINEIADEYLTKGGVGHGGARIKGVSGLSGDELKAYQAKMSKEDDANDKIAYAAAGKRNSQNWAGSGVRAQVKEESTDIKSSIDRQQSRAVKEERRLELAKQKQEELRLKVTMLKEEEKKNILKIAANENRRRAIVQEARGFFIEKKKTQLLEEQKQHEIRLAQVKAEEKAKQIRQESLAVEKARREGIIEESRKMFAEQKRKQILEQQRIIRAKKEQEILAHRKIVEEQKAVEAEIARKAKLESEAKQKAEKAARAAELRRISIIEESKQFFQAEKQLKLEAKAKLEDSRKRDAIERISQFVEESVSGLNPTDSFEVKKRLRGKSLPEIRSSIRSIIRGVVEESTKAKLQVTTKEKPKGKGMIQESFNRSSSAVREDLNDPYSAAGSLI